MAPRPHEIRRNMTLKECARAVRNVYDSLMVLHEKLMYGEGDEFGHDHAGWAECSCDVAKVLRLQSQALDPSGAWMRGKR